MAVPRKIINPKESVDLSALYQPQPKQVAFHSSRAPYRLMVGGAGSGKSLALLWEALDFVYSFPGFQALLLRRNYPELEKGLIADLRSTLPPHTYHWDDSDHIATFPMAAGRAPSKIFFGYCKDGKERSLSQYLSSAFPFIGIDEMGQFSFWAWQFLSSRNRINVGCEPNAQGRMPAPCMAGATNPMGPGWPWIKRMWLDLSAPPEAGDSFLINPDEYFHVHSTILDNQRLLDRDPGYLDKLKKLPEDLRKKLLDGDVNLVSGQYYSNFTRERHVVDLDADPGRVEWQPWQPVWISLDWGLAHFACAHWFTRALVRRPDGTRSETVVCYRELIVRETGIKDFARLMAEMCDGRFHGSPAQEKEAVTAVFVSHELFARRSDPSPDQTVAFELGRALKRRHLPFPQRAAGSASTQERRTGAAMIYEDLEAGELVFLASCHRTVSALPMLARSETDIEDVQKTETMEDDIFDSLKHGVLSIRRGRAKPLADEIRSRAEAIEDPVKKWFFLRAHNSGIGENDKWKNIGTELGPMWASRSQT